jgi:hypothetical protein
MPPYCLERKEWAVEFAKLVDNPVFADNVSWVVFTR